MDLGNSVATVAKFILLVTDEVAYSCSVRNGPLRQLQNELGWLQAFIKEADSAQNMDEEIYFLLDKAGDLIETCLNMIVGQMRRIGVMRCATIFNNRTARLMLLKEIGLIRTSLSELLKIPSEYHRSMTPTYDAEMDNSRTMNRIQSPDDSEIIGFDDDLKKLKEQLIEVNGDTMRVVSISGEPGSGKTTLAEALYNSADVKNHFQFRVWVYMSPDLSPRDFFQSILNVVDGGPSKDSTDNLKAAVYRSLQDRRFLIVLDDVQNPQKWLFEILEYLLHKNKNGSRVMITSRDSDWGSFNSKIFIHMLHKLNEEASWTLFLRKGRWSEDDSLPQFKDSLHQLKERIYKETEGLPLAIAILGGLLSTRVQSLPELSKKIDDKKLCFDRDHEFDLKRILEASYIDLPRELMPFFLYFGLFPREFEIPVRRLCGLWSAEGYQGVWEQRRFVGPNHVIKELSKRNLIQVGRRRPDGTLKTCRMSTTLHDFAVDKAKVVHHHCVHSSAQSLEPDPEHDVRRLAEWVDTSGRAGNPSSQVDRFRYLRSYLSFNFQKADTPEEQAGKLIHEIVRTNRGFGLLRVLDLERVYKPSLPESLGKLFNLRYLGLRWTFIDTLPSSVGDLTCLETLDVKHTFVTHLPPSIWKMQQLRHLYLSDTRLDWVPHESLAALQTLWGLAVDEGSYLTYGLESLTNLTKLGLTCRLCKDPKGVLSNWMLELKNLRSLRLRSLDRSGRPYDLSWLEPFTTDHSHLSDLYLTGSIKRPLNVNEFPPNLKMLTLSASNLEEDPMRILGQLKSLTILRLFGNAYTGRSMSCLHGFPELQVLKLWKQENLEEWNVQEGAMPKLKELEVRLCGKLKQFPVGLIQNRQGELELTTTNMPEEFVKAAQAHKGNKFAVIKNEWK